MMHVMLISRLIAFIPAGVFSVSSELQTKRNRRKYVRKIIYRNNPRKTKTVPVNILRTKCCR